jgi:hypothetical protein
MANAQYQAMRLALGDSTLGICQRETQGFFAKYVESSMGRSHHLFGMLLVRGAQNNGL